MGDRFRKYENRYKNPPYGSGHTEDFLFGDAVWSFRRPFLQVNSVGYLQLFLHSNFSQAVSLGVTAFIWGVLVETVISLAEQAFAWLYLHSSTWQIKFSMIAPPFLLDD